MNRAVTNTLRFFMDELLPPFIRDNRYFMYPFFHYWFKGKNLELYMEFKSLVHGFSDEEFTRIYQDLDCRATDRQTDMNRACVEYILGSLDPSAESLIDIGCGNAFLLREVQRTKGLKLHGCDLLDSINAPQVIYTRGNLENLPFNDNAFDIVCCTHTLEHTRDLCAAVSELKRIARKQLVIVVPKQRYYYYTLDLHVSFFHTARDLTGVVDLRDHSCENVGGDWVYVGNVD